MINGVLLDIEGVLYTGNNPIMGSIEAVEKLQQRGIRRRFLTNITTKPRSKIAEMLLSMGFNIDKDEILNPVTAASKYINEKGYGSVATYADCAIAEDLGFSVEPANGQYNRDCVIMGNIGRAINFDVMDEIFSIVMNGGDLLALQKDRYYKGPEKLIIDLGAFVAGIEYSTGKKARIMGKPSFDFFSLAINELSIKKDEILMIGDDLNSDILGGNQVGVTTVLVLSGKTIQLTMDIDEQLRPNYIVNRLEEIWKLPIWE